MKTTFGDAWKTSALTGTDDALCDLQSQAVCNLIQLLSLLSIL